MARCTTVSIIYVASTRFVKCEKCSHFFVVLSENEGTKKIKEDKAKKRQPPPTPKKVTRILLVLHVLSGHGSFQIYDYLNKYIIGQEYAKKVMSVAVYNHYKRLHNNIPATPAAKPSSNATESLSGLMNTPSNQQQQQQRTLQCRVFHIFHRVLAGFILNVGIPFYTVPLDGTSTNPTSTTNASQETKNGSDVIHSDKYNLKLEKSNILMLGPTGSGKQR